MPGGIGPIPGLIILEGMPGLGIGIIPGLIIGGPGKFPGIL